MSKNAWIVAVVVAIVFAGGGFWSGMSYAASKRPSFGGAGTVSFGARGGAAGATVVARGGAGGATAGTIIQIGNGSITVQLPSSTSTSAQTGTKLVLVGNSTQVSEMESVPLSSLKVGDVVAVSGPTNSDGSVTASSVQILPRGAAAR